MEQEVDVYLHQATFHNPFKIKQRVRKVLGAWWEGKVVGFYSTEDNPMGVCVQLDTVPHGPVQIYPAHALEAIE